MREVEANHGERPLLVEHNVGGFGVDFDVELGHGTPVAHVVAAAHEHDFLHALNDARLHAHGHRDIGERAGGNQGDGARLACHDGFHDVVHRVLLLKRAGWHGQLDAVQAAFAVNRGSHFLRAHDGAVASGVHGHVGGVRLFEHRAGVVSHLFEALVASDGGHAQKLDFGVAQREQDGDGVVVSWIAIQDDLLRHDCSFKRGVACMPSAKYQEYSVKGITLKFNAFEMNRTRKLKVCIRC